MLQRNSLFIVCDGDGSVMIKISKKLCSESFIIYFPITHKMECGSVVEFSSLTYIYREEILGAVLTQLLLYATTTRVTTEYITPDINCDNLGLAGHGNKPKANLKEKQAQAFLL